MNVLKSIFLLFFLICSAYSSSLYPNKVLHTSGGVTDIVIYDKKLYAATKASSVDIFDLKNKKLIEKIKIPKIKDFLGDIIDSKIYSIDVINDKVLILSQGNRGGRNINVYENGKFTNIIPDEKRMFIAKAKFIDNNTIIFSLLSNQLYLYDLLNKKTIYLKQVSQSKFSDFVLNEDKSEIIISDESGDLKLFDTITGQLLQLFERQNLDNVFKVDYKNGIVLTAGQDRRAVIYTKSNTYFKKSNFIIYSCGLSPSGQRGAYSSNEENDVIIFNTESKKNLFLLTENKMLLTNILFINENELFISSDDRKINYYKLENQGE